jgi:hypothetical protein
VTGESFRRPPTCEHEGAPLIVGTVEWWIGAAAEAGEFREMLLEIVHELRPVVGVAGVIRICSECMCVTLGDGAHAGTPGMKNRV